MQLLLRNMWLQLAILVVSSVAFSAQRQSDDWIISAGDPFIVEDKIVKIPESGEYESKPPVAFHVFCDACDGANLVPRCSFRGKNQPTPGFFNDYINGTYDAVEKRYDLRLTRNLDKEGPANELPESLQCEFPSGPDYKEVVILNVNDNKPDVYPRCEAVVEENMDYTSPSGNSILDFMSDCGSSPSDGDNDVLYFKLPEEWVANFEIVGSKLHARNNFDFETTSYYSGITVIVQDREEDEPDVLRSETTVVITVEDKQDRPPQFLLLTPQIELLDESEKDKKLAEFRAEDGDTPKIAREIRYALTKGNDKGLFRIVTEPFEATKGGIGRIYLIDDFDLEAQESGFEPFFQLEIEAREIDEDGNPVPDVDAFATYTAFVAIRDVDDNCPEFVGPTELPPIPVVEHELGFSQNFTVIDRDYDLQAYKVEINTIPAYVQQELKAFRVIPQSGFKETPFILTVQNESALDYENVEGRNITVIVTAFSESDTSQKREMKMYVELQDDNDQTPQFTKPPEEYTATIPEGVADEYVMTVQATDADTNEDYGTSSIRYSLFGAAEALQLFSINAETGEIRTSATSLTDFETGQHPYELTVVASDKYDEPGVGVNRNQTSITIQIENVNDEAPIFSSIEAVTVAETDLNRIIVKNLAQYVEDPDYAAGVALELSFAINPEESEAMLNNVVVDMDYEKAFEVKNNADGTWDLLTMEAPDREAVDVIKLGLVVSDEKTDIPEKKTASRILTINVEDKNDHPPVITIPTSGKDPSIPELANDGRVLTFSVGDKDATAPNNEFNVSVEPKDFFELDCRETNYCDLLWTQPFDREDSDSVEVSLLATDLGDPPMEAKTVKVIITIEDMNDQTPEFTNLPTGTLELEEHLPVGTLIFTATAKDDDIGINQELCFEWGKNNDPAEQALFDIGKLTGEITVGNSPDGLDREKFPSLIGLEVVVYDKCNENTVDLAPDYKYTYAKIQIQLQDRNDNSPTFPGQVGECFFRLDETASEGDRADEVIYAIDPDFGKNGSLAYSLTKMVNLTDGSEISADLVQLADGGLDEDGRKTAVLEVVGIDQWVDRWGKYNVSLTAYDMDGEEGALNGSVEYTLCVKNVNNNPPVITQPTELEFVVLNTLQTGDDLIPEGSEEPLRVVVTDADGGLTNFRFEALSSLNHFGIKRDEGIITVENPLNGEVPWIEEVRISVFDSDPEASKNGARLETSITLKIRVTDGNNQPAVIGDQGQHQELSITENDPDFSAMVHQGEDPNFDTVYYYLVGGPRELFNLDPLTGNLTLTEALDREQLELPLVLVMRVTDRKDPPVNQDEEFDEDDKALLEITIQVVDVKDVPTTFSTALFTGAITLDASAQQSVLRIFADDPDLDTRLEFSIDGVIPEDPSLAELDRNSFDIRQINGEPLQAEIAINFEPQPDMRGSVVLDLSAWDPDEPDRNVARTQAILTMLVKENQIALEFVNYYKEVENKRQELLGALQKTLGDPVQGTVMVDKIEGVASSGGTGAINRTVVATHFERSNGEILEGELITNLLQLPEKGAEIVQACKEINLDFLTYSVGKTFPPEEATIKTLYFYVAVAACGVAVVGLVLMFLLYKRHADSLKRQLKAMTTTTFGSQESGINRLGLELPNTNAFALEENPLHNVDESQIRDDISSNSGDSILIGVEDNPEFNSYPQNQPIQGNKPDAVAKKKRPAPAPPALPQHMGMVNPVFSAELGDDSSGYGDFDLDDTRRPTEDPFGEGQQRINPLLQFKSMNFAEDGDDEAHAEGEFSFGPRAL